MSLGRGIIAAGAAGSANLELRTGARADGRVATRSSCPPIRVAIARSIGQRQEADDALAPFVAVVRSYAILRCDHSRRRMNRLTSATQIGRTRMASAQIVMTNSRTAPSA